MATGNFFRIAHAVSVGIDSRTATFTTRDELEARTVVHEGVGVVVACGFVGASRGAFAQEVCRSGTVEPSTEHFDTVSGHAPRLFAWVVVRDYGDLDTSISRCAEPFGGAGSEVTARGDHLTVNHNAVRAFAIRAAHAVAVLVRNVELVEHTSIQASVAATGQGVRRLTRTVVEGGFSVVVACRFIGAARTRDKITC